MRATIAGFSRRSRRAAASRARCRAAVEALEANLDGLCDGHGSSFGGDRFCHRGVLRFQTTLMRSGECVLASSRDAPGPSQPWNQPVAQAQGNPDEAAPPRLHPGPSADLRELRSRPERRAARRAREAAAGRRRRARALRLGRIRRRQDPPAEGPRAGRRRARRRLPARREFRRGPGARSSPSTTSRASPRRSRSSSSTPSTSAPSPSSWSRRARRRAMSRCAATSPRASPPGSPTASSPSPTRRSARPSRRTRAARGFALADEVSSIPPHARAPRHALAHRRARHARPLLARDRAPHHRCRC